MTLRRMKWKMRDKFRIGQQVRILRISVNGVYMSLTGEVVGYGHGQYKGKISVRANGTLVMIDPANLEAV